MADSLAGILANKNFEEPPEMQAIKKFIYDTFQADAEVVVREREIIIGVRSASLANALRLKITALRQAAQTDKRLVLRIV